MGQEVCAPCKQFSSEEKTNEIEKGKNVINPTNIFIDEKEDLNKDNNGTNRNCILNTMSGGMDQNTFLEKWEKQLPLLGRKITETDFNNLIPETLYTYLTNNPYLLDSAANNNINNLKNKKNFAAPPIEFKTNGNFYSGNWNENLRIEGYGKMYMKDAEVLAEGIWEDGIFKYGRVFLPNGDRYEGEIFNSNFNGNGKLFLNDGTEYTGEFYNGKKNGKGTIIFPDGSKFKGNFKNDYLDNGEFNWINGIKYEGNFVDSKLNGKGKISNTNGNSFYDGEFVDNKFHGNGKYVFNNGDVYEGEYKYGKKNGTGKYSNKNFVYYGNWIEGKQHGIGEFTVNDKKIQCSWRNGEVVEMPHDLNNYYNNLDNEKEMLNFEPQDEDINCDQLNYLVYDKNNFQSFRPETNLSDHTD